MERKNDTLKGNEMRRKDREINDIKLITDILETCKTANVAMVDGDMPYVIPLSYGYEIKENSLILYFHCAKEGRKTDILKNNNRVCFSVFDEGELSDSEIPCNLGYYYSSVTGNGVAEFIDSFAEKSYALSKMFEHQTGKKADFTETQTASVCVFKIIVNDYTGKQKARLKPD